MYKITDAKNPEEIHHNKMCDYYEGIRKKLGESETSEHALELKKQRDRILAKR